MWKPKALYSQNYEDLYLWRLFKDIQHGFYIDVGAWDPNTDSVTKIFYDQGWRGINIEPVEEYWLRLSGDRQRDINLQVALSSPEHVGVRLMNVYKGSGLSSMKGNVISSDTLENTALLESQDSVPVQVITLREIIDANCVSPIDFLKIDSEGEEFNVLTGLGFSSLPKHLRPKVILLEATRPNSNINSAHRNECRRLLEQHDYSHIFFDGLNDYYCEYSLRDTYIPKMLPPNVYDDFSIHCSAVHADRIAIKALRADNTSISKRLNDKQALLATCTRNYQQALHELERAREEANQYKLRLSELAARLNQQEELLDTHRIEHEQHLISFYRTKEDANQYLLKSSELELALAERNSVIIRQEGKIDWLRTQRQMLLSLVKSYSLLIKKAVKVMSSLAFGSKSLLHSKAHHS